MCLGREKSDGYRCVYGERRVMNTGMSMEREEQWIQVCLWREKSDGYRCVYGERRVMDAGVSRKREE